MNLKVFRDQHNIIVRASTFETRARGVHMVLHTPYVYMRMRPTGMIVNVVNGVSGFYRVCLCVTFFGYDFLGQILYTNNTIVT